LCQSNSFSEGDGDRPTKGQSLAGIILPRANVPTGVADASQHNQCATLSILVATSAAKFERFSRQADAPQALSLFLITVTKVSHGLGFQGQIAFRMKDGKRLFKILGGLFQISLATEYRTDGGICHGLSHLVPGGLPAPNSFLEFGNRLPALVP